ncbi:DUF6479 family protein [Streptomyces phaeoluteigriseus]|uniref:DUF6479 family protein n=1 Tax=Streptomyces phaeoluteigriseus TaxID=114686 RepID=A0ABY4Z752_9ACTN|nr:DUF6479 family protein [Streptomyces phaeoluteigriseus]USQ84879.1 DUF6479 family protein [Streptomyces phaeoluteigriseus]
MDTFATTVLAASGRSALATVAFVVVGVALVGGLIWAFRLGAKIRSREPAPPRPEEQPRRPASGPVGESHGAREPNEMPRPEDGERLTAHELRPTGSRESDDQSRPRWNQESGGSFGSGGPGAR